MQEILLAGKSNGLFNPNSPVHVDLWHWIWPPVVQKRLDYFVDYWNSHRVRSQKKKLMPSGTTPMNIFTTPAKYGGARLSQPVSLECIQELRNNLSETREEAFRWVEDDFAAAAEEVYEAVGSPSLSLATGWQVFSMMSPVLETMYKA